MQILKMKVQLIKKIDWTWQDNHKFTTSCRGIAVYQKTLQKSIMINFFRESKQNKLGWREVFFHFLHKSFRRSFIIHRKSKLLHTRSVIFADVLLPELRHFIESDPCLSLLYVLQLFHDFFFSDSVPFCNSPKLSEFVE